MFGFCETADEAFADPGAKRKEKMIDETIERIKNSPEWLEGVKQHAEKEGVSLDEMLRNAAIYTIEMDKKNKQQ